MALPVICWAETTWPEGSAAVKEVVWMVGLVGPMPPLSALALPLALALALPGDWEPQPYSPPR